ncbi:nucleoside recognition domain-containing protein [Paenibacillus yanchengensis]|uniref:Nucleoside recognition domain-containing protein n=1 Tax=Paenibacillus yanchengensis TaxID=2035833 RepID=A0ABW4YMI5_9BACL
MKKTMLLAAFFFTIVCLIISQPETTFQASLQGLKVWWEIVFPGLLPFLVLFEMMLAFGLLHAFGKLLEPMMQRLFRLPGEAAVVVAIGWIGGMPTGTNAIKKLLDQQVLNEKQANQLAAFAHMPSPLFIIIIVGSAFLQQPITGIIILLAVWLSSIWIFFLSNLFRKDKRLQQKNEAILNHSLPSSSVPLHSSTTNIWKQAVSAMRLAQQQDGRSFGKLLGDAVSISVQRLFVIGGFMIFAAMLAFLVEPIFSWTGLPFLGKSLLEIHLGTHAVANIALESYSILVATAIIAAVCAFTGLSGIMQASYSLFGTAFQLGSFIVYRVVHAAHAFFFAVLLFKPIYHAFQLWAGTIITPVLHETIPTPTSLLSPPTAQLWSAALLCTLIIALLAFILNKTLHYKTKTPH